MWSPDGQWIAYVSGNVQYPPTANLAPSSIWVVRSAGGAPIRITDDRPLHASPAWLPDSRGLFYVSDQDGGTGHLFRPARPVGRAGRSAGPAHHRAASAHDLTFGGRPDTACTVVYTETSNVFTVPLQPGRSVSLRDATPVTTGSQVIEGFSISPDGRWLAFDSNRNGNQDIWRMPLDGSAPPEPLSAGTGGRVPAGLLARTEGS